MICTPRAMTMPGGSFVLVGDCGERVELGDRLVLDPAQLPASSCADFRAAALATFGARRPVVPGDGSPAWQEESVMPTALVRAIRGGCDHDMRLPDPFRRTGF